MLYCQIRARKGITYRVFQKTCNNFLPQLKLGLSQNWSKLYIKLKYIIIQFCWLLKFLKMIPNKSIMTSYTKSPYFTHVPVSVLLDLTKYHITDVVKTFINACLKCKWWDQYRKSIQNVRYLICTNFTDTSRCLVLTEPPPPPPKKKRRRDTAREGLPGFKS